MRRTYERRLNGLRKDEAPTAQSWEDGRMPPRRSTRNALGEDETKGSQARWSVPGGEQAALRRMPGCVRAGEMGAPGFGEGALSRGRVWYV
ncbi:hypothetical protein GCM10009678_03500 [Actinomadura kijaniata]